MTVMIPWVISMVFVALSLGISIGCLITRYDQYKREKLAIRRGHIMIGDQQIFKLVPITLMDVFAMDQRTGYSNNLKKYMEGE